MKIFKMIGTPYGCNFKDTGHIHTCHGIMHKKDKGHIRDKLFFILLLNNKQQIMPEKIDCYIHIHVSNTKMRNIGNDDIYRMVSSKNVSPFLISIYLGRILEASG